MYGKSLSIGWNQDDVHEVPARQVDHEQVKRSLDPLSGQDKDGDHVDQHANDGHAEAHGAIKPVLQAEKKK